MRDDAPALLERDFNLASSLPLPSRQDEQLRIVRRISASIAAPECQTFMLKIAGDTSQLDLVRVEALKGISNSRSSLTLAHHTEMTQLLRELSKSSTKLIRLWAVSEMQWFADSPEILEYALRVAGDDSVDEDTRIAALDTIEKRGPCDRSIELLRSLRTGDELPGFALVLRQPSTDG